MYEYLDKLNPKQKEAAMHLNGPLLIVAGAGSGKTTVLINRLSYMVDKGINPENILLLTFTNNAADNMVERAGKLSNEECKKVTACTYHSFCAYIIRKYYKELGLSKDFDIIMPSEEEDAFMLMKAQLGFQHLKKFPPAKNLVTLRSLCINKQYDLEETVEEYFGTTGVVTEILEVLKALDQYKKEKSLLNYDDLLLYMNQLLDIDEIRDELENQYKYIMVDEYQDTNALQESIIFKLTKKNKNLAVVGDDYQCWHKNCTVITENGIKTIADLQIGDKVQTILKGKVQFAEVTNKSEHISKTIKITTESGKQIQVTKKHKMFASYPEFDGASYVYLMYRADKGFRIGITSGGELKNFSTRTQSERAEKLWVLGRYETKNEAHYYENLLSLQYQIPQLPFYCYGRNILTVQKDIDSIFEKFGNNGFQLLEDYEMSFDYPNFIPQGTTRNQECKKNIYLQMDSAHRYNQVSYENKDIHIRKCFSNYKDAVYFAEFLIKEYDANFIERLFIDKRTFLKTIPASQLTTTMKIPVIQDEKIVLEKIVNISKEDDDYDTVYHIEIAQTGILIANNIASHNCIYAFRGSDIQNILEFPKRIGGCKTVIIDTNYRSTKEILKVANQIMKEHATFGFTKEMKDCGKSGKTVLMEVPYDTKEEAEKIMERIHKWIEKGNPLSEFAILERQSRTSAFLEAMLTKEGIPFEKLGGLKFLEHQCVIDILNYFRIVSNPKDELAWFHILDLLPGIGEVYAHRILADFGTDLFLCNEIYKKKSFYEEMRRLHGLWSGLYHSSNKLDFIRQFEIIRDRYFDLRERKIQNAHFEDESHREEALQQLESDKETISTLKDMAEKYHSIPKFLDSLILDATPVLNKEDKLVISTIHSSKGMEWDMVILLDCMDGIIPSINDLDEDEGMESLRCLYVALTRAKKRLIIETPEVVNSCGCTFSNSSRFLEGCIKKGYIKEKYSNIIKKEKIYFDISYYEKDEAKKLGAKWDFEKRCWYCYNTDDTYNLLKKKYDIKRI